MNTAVENELMQQSEDIMLTNTIANYPTFKYLLHDQSEYCIEFVLRHIPALSRRYKWEMMHNEITKYRATSDPMEKSLNVIAMMLYFSKFNHKEYLRKERKLKEKQFEINNK
jgi:hypothetical protein